MVRIRELTSDDGPACDAIVASLPTFFGDPDGNRECAEAVRTQQGWVASLDDEIVGFLTVAPSSDEVSEITWMGVRDDHRGRGIGRELIDHLVRSSTARALCVLTLGPSVPDAGYEGTRAFYRAMGFVPVKELGLRSWNNSHALLLVRPLSTK
jgi:ribosomal protein S18 acetylase RimI-like enzyme